MSRPNVHRISLPRPEVPPGDSKLTAEDRIEEPIGTHVLEGEETVLFGTGYASSGDELVAALRDLGGVDVVVVEHGDPDHYGGLPAVLEAFPDATVAVPAADSDALDEVGLTPDVELEHGDRQWGVRSIHVPGHTPGNMSFLHESSGILVVGDSFVHRDSPVAADGNWTGPFAPIAPQWNADDGAARRNLDRLAHHEFSDALLTHGPDVRTDAGRAVDSLLADLGVA